jgi:hypothetical protein
MVVSGSCRSDKLLDRLERCAASKSKAITEMVCSPTRQRGEVPSDSAKQDECSVFRRD